MTGWISGPDGRKIVHGKPPDNVPHYDDMTSFWAILEYLYPTVNKDLGREFNSFYRAYCFRYDMLLGRTATICNETILYRSLAMFMPIERGKHRRVGGFPSKTLRHNLITITPHVLQSREQSSARYSQCLSARLTKSTQQILTQQMGNSSDCTNA